MPLRGSDCFVFVVISPSPGAQEMEKGDWALFYFGNMRVTEEDQTLVLSPYSLPLVQGLHAVSVPYSSSILLTHHLQRECRQHQERSMWVCEPGERWTAAFGALFPNSAHRTQWDNVDHGIALWLYRDVAPIDPSCIFLTIFILITLQITWYDGTCCNLLPLLCLSFYSIQCLRASVCLLNNITKTKVWNVFLRTARRLFYFIELQHQLFCHLLLLIS